MSNQSKPLILPKVIERSIVFEESLIKIQRDKLQIDNQPTYYYYTLLNHPYAVAILPISPDGAFVLIEEYRHPTNSILLGCPAGYIDPGEDILKAAQRELLEETGFQAESFKVMGSAFPFTGFSGQKTIYVKALGAFFNKKPQLETSEIIRTIILMPNELESMINKGANLDGTLCTALYFHRINDD